MQEYRKNLGKVSLTTEGAWTKDKSFDILSIVYDEHNLHGFISKQFVPEGVDLYNKEYWMPFNVSGYADNNIIILSEKISETAIKAYTLEEAINSVATVGRRPGMILGFYNENTDRLDIGGRWEIWQFNSTTISEWEDVAHWQNIYYSFNKFVGWYRDVESLKKYNPFPEIGCYAYVGTEFNEATIYRCDTKFIWTDTTQHAWDYIKVILQGNVTVGENGNWFNDGIDTGIPASIKGENGKTPVFRQYDNTIQYSFDNVNWITISDKVAAWFRWNATTGDTQANNVGRIQISRDNVTWTNLSGDIVNKLHISRYIGADETLPTSGVAEGTIYAKGPYYEDTDINHDYPAYRIWVYAWKDETLAWVDHGQFTSIAAGIVQETGDSETVVMSQKATTEKLTELATEVGKSFINGYKTSGTILLQNPKIGTKIYVKAISKTSAANVATFDALGNRLTNIFTDDGVDIVFDGFLSITEDVSYIAVGNYGNLVIEEFRYAYSNEELYKEKFDKSNIDDILGNNETKVISQIASKAYFGGIPTSFISRSIITYENGVLTISEGYSYVTLANGLQEGLLCEGIKHTVSAGNIVVGRALRIIVLNAIAEFQKGDIILAYFEKQFNFSPNLSISGVIANWINHVKIPTYVLGGYGEREDLGISQNFLTKEKGYLVFDVDKSANNELFTKDNVSIGDSIEFAITAVNTNNLIQIFDDSNAEIVRYAKQNSEVGDKFIIKYRVTENFSVAKVGSWGKIHFDYILNKGKDTSISYKKQILSNGDIIELGDYNSGDIVFLKDELFSEGDIVEFMFEAVNGSAGIEFRDINNVRIKLIQGSNTTVSNALTIPNFLYVTAVYGGTVTGLKIRKKNYYKLPIYDNDYIEEKSFEILEDQIKEAGNKNDMFFYFTDTHATSSPMTSPSVIGELMKKTNVTKAVFGGDLCMSSDDYDGLIKSVKAQGLYYNHINPYGELYNVRGNHDFNITEDGVTSMLSNSKTKQLLLEKNYNNITLNNDDIDGGFYYYFDNEVAGIRYIVIDNSLFTIDDIQMLWIANAIMGTNKKIVLLPHIGLVKSVSTSPNSELVEVIKAVNDKTSYNIRGQVFNFSNTSASIIAVISGHSHQDLQDMVGGVAHIAVDSDNAGLRTNKAYYNASDARGVGTRNENCISCFRIDNTNNVINEIRIGKYDRNRYYHLGYISLSNGGSVGLSTKLTGTITWSSYDSKSCTLKSDGTLDVINTVASVDNGIVTALNLGEAVILAIDENNKKEVWNIKVE